MTSLAPLLEAFFTDRLCAQRQVSGNTISAYRDAFCLLLRFTEKRLAKIPSALLLTDVDAPLIGAFLDHLETKRRNSVRTRNARLAAIHSFFRYVSVREPAHANMIQRVLAIPPKRADRKIVSFLTRTEIDALLAATDRSTWIGRRDHLLILLGIQSSLTFFADDLAREKWITFGGCGGEIWISALCVVAFYHRAPDRVRWDFWRFPVVLLGMTTLAYAWGLWSDVAADHTRLPLGTGFKGRGDSNGDMNRLLDIHGWSVQEIVDAYRLIAFIAVAFVLAHYAWSLMRSKPSARRG